MRTSFSSLGAREARTPARLAWPFAPWLAPLAAAYALFDRWRVVYERAVSHSGSPLAPEQLAWMATLTHALGVLGGSAVLVVAWRALGERMPFWRLAALTGAFSVLSNFADQLRLLAPDYLGAAFHAAVVFGGIGAADTFRGSDAGLAAAFANFGVLELTRLALLGWAQARAVSRPAIVGIGLAIALWLTIRVVTWFALDLLAGQSGLGGS